MQLFRVATGQGNISLRSGKINILKKSQGKLKLFNMAGVIPLKTGGNFQGYCDLNGIFLNGEGNFFENLSVLMNEWKGWL